MLNNNTHQLLPHPSRTSITMCGWGAGAAGVQSMMGMGSGNSFKHKQTDGGRVPRKGVQATCTVHWTPIVCLAGAVVKAQGRPSTACGSHDSGSRPLLGDPVTRRRAQLSPMLRSQDHQGAVAGLVHAERSLLLDSSLFEARENTKYTEKSRC